MDYMDLLKYLIQNREDIEMSRKIKKEETGKNKMTLIYKNKILLEDK